MHIVLYGATGQIGQVLLNEALNRGHEVTAVVRDPARLTLQHPRLRVRTGDVGDEAGIVAATSGADAVIASLTARRDGNPDVIPGHAERLLGLLPKAGVKHLLWIGGAGSLEVAPGVRLVDTPTFPPAYLAEARSQAEALAVFRASRPGLDWTFFSPAALIEPGERTGHYRLGGDQLLTDAEGVSRISIADFAMAVLDRAERRDALNRRVTVAY